LAYGSPTKQHPEGLPVLPVDTLLAVAEEARAQRAAQGHTVRWVATVLDARMDELYVALYEHHGGVWHERSPARLCAPQDVAAWVLTHVVLDSDAWAQGQWLWAGNVWAEDSPYAPRLRALLGVRCTALPTAAALLRVASAPLALGQALRPHDVLPLYVRDKVALTTAEREARDRRDHGLSARSDPGEDIHQHRSERRIVELTDLGTGHEGPARSRDDEGHDRGVALRMLHRLEQRRAHRLPLRLVVAQASCTAAPPAPATCGPRTTV
jgi:tRNA A37 threonylcarbamoyladenosine modification protein TsaB